jgi:hypothetical protein
VHVYICERLRSTVFRKTKCGGHCKLEPLGKRDRGPSHCPRFLLDVICESKTDLYLFKIKSNAARFSVEDISVLIECDTT